MTLSKCPFCGTVNDRDQVKTIELRIDGFKRFACVQHTLAGAKPEVERRKEAAE